MSGGTRCTALVGALGDFFGALRHLDIGEIVAAASKTSTELFADHSGALIDLANNSSMTVESLQRLTGATMEYRSAAVQLILGFESAKRQIDAMFGDTARTIQMAGMTDQQRYNFLQAESEQLLVRALQSSDAAEIQRLAGLINQDINAAFGLLSPEQQRAMQQEYLSRLGTTNADLQAHLTTAQQRAEDRANATLTRVESIMSAVAAKLDSAASSIERGGEAIQAGAGADHNLNIRVYDDRVEAHNVNDGG